MATQKFVEITTYFNGSNWYGKFDSKILLNLSFRKQRKQGTLQDTLWVDSDIFCDVDKRGIYVEKKQFKDTQMCNTNGNAGSFSTFMNYSPTILRKIRKVLRVAGYTLIDKTKITLSQTLKEQSEYVPNKHDDFMTALFNR